MLASEKLKRHFEENPIELKSLRHDKELHPARVQNHLKRIPEYLLPENARTDKKKISFIPFHKPNKVGKKSKNSKNKKRKGGKTDALKKF